MNRYSVVCAAALSVAVGLATPTALLAAQSRSLHGAGPAIADGAPVAPPEELVYVDINEYISYSCACITILSANLNRFLGSVGQSIYSAPTGVAVDSLLNVYVASLDAEGKPQISVFKRGGRAKPFRIITGLTGVAVALAVGPDGTVYQADFGNYYVRGVIEEIAPGASAPTYELVDPYMHDPVDVKVSASREVFVAYQGSSFGHVRKYRHDSNIGTTLPLTVGQIRGIALDASGNVVVSNDSNSRLEVYGQNAEQPKRILASGIAYPSFMAFDASQQHLFVVAFSSGSVGSVLRFDYPSGTYIAESGTLGYYPYEVAVSPPAP